ncbi:NAD(P)-binding domain-containing protein [Paeniglutamicibacter psychrophenolicus]|uniref:Flavoprotein involved in K+ transport n=1 Tax=Paeniglutamicibacter psychrophenolicus TaxID=257454 RepID=A0ABS4WIR9_9MICC|nr:NAD(P)-binding domain-containing protein [Paeniglutamicibacter psychrophenolicus]MBP2376090.1 putative flavoprotein involved in K+ transport [Paeniglutamicibacter psychrophenolicus]
MPEKIDTVVIGAGQAGLAVSRELGIRGIGHAVLERSRVGQSWRERWDSFTLVTPNWTMDLPGSPYSGADPEGHVPRDQIVGYLEDYRSKWHVPVREGINVNSLLAGTESRFELATSLGPINANNVVVCTGSFSKPHRPPVGMLPPGLPAIDALEYRNPAELPPGKVLVIGSGQTGCQLAEELFLAGREVFLSCGRAPRMPRWLDGIDIVTWLSRTGFFDLPLASLPSPGARLLANPQNTGAAGGHDLDFRTLQRLGVVLLGHLAHVDGHRASFVDDLGASVAFGDARWAELRALLAAELPAQGYEVPGTPIEDAFRYDPVTDLDLNDIGVVIFTAGYRPDYGWIDFPVCDESGFPITEAGTSPVPGLFFCGVHFMRVRRSALLFGVGLDAALVAESLASPRRPRDA